MKITEVRRILMKNLLNKWWFGVIIIVVVLLGYVIGVFMLNNKVEEDVKREIYELK